MSNFETHPKEIRTLLQLIHSGELALPDFQRNFVWDPGAIEELLESIMKQYPAGSLLFLKDSGDKFQVREFENAPKLLSQRSPSQLALDGQQRLTSLYQAYYGKGNHLFFIDLNCLKDEIDIEGAVFNRSVKKAQKQNLLDIKEQAKSLIFPFSHLIDGKFDQWLDEIMDLRTEDASEKRILKDELRKVDRELLRPMLDYKFPVVTLQKETSMDAVCMMFETLNRRGVKLTVFELLMARSFAESVSLRQLLDQTFIDHPVIESFNVDPYHILQAICLIEQGSIKRKDVLELSPKIINQYWKEITECLADGIKFLQREEGVITHKLVPYSTMLVPLAAVLYKTKNIKEIEVGQRNLKIRQWFWSSVFASTYEIGPTGRAVSDYKELLRYIQGEEIEMYSLKKLYYTPEMLFEVTPRQRAHYNGVLALIASNGCKDFHNGSYIGFDYFKEKYVDDHHIFPKNFLKGKKVQEERINCVVNRTFIDASTNRTISDTPPSKYLIKIEKALGPVKSEEIFNSHLISVQFLKNDLFEEFLKERAHKIFDLLSSKIGRVIPSVPQNDELVDDEEIEDETSLKDNLDPNLVNSIPVDQLEDYPQLTKQIFELLFKRTKELDEKIWSRTNKRNVSFFSPEKSFYRASFQKSGIKLLVFTDGKELAHVTPITQDDGGGQLYGRAKIRSFEELDKVFPSLEESRKRMLQAISEGKNTSWWRGKKEE